MAICTQCGQDCPEGFRFCGACGAPLSGHSSGLRDERKVVSVLFCDLVGFTAASHTADPEDVRRVLATYHAAVREAVERFGGVVEKFIGDAAVGVWGVPQAHEDDAERAVRAALAILDSVDVDVRIAVNTGEVLATVDPASDSRIGVVGDVVNTASRLQAAAPVGGVLVGEATVRLSQPTVRYEPLVPIALKGKPDPVPAWRVIAVGTHGARSAGERTSPFVGRERELQLLQNAWARVIDSCSLQLIVITGEPGIGKSRLVSEFTDWVTRQPQAPVCRRGRCLAYGNGVGFWPLAEIIKQELQLSETATQQEAESRLAEAVAGMPDASWLRARIAPLVGLPGESGERDQVFTAWQRFLCEVAARSPLVLILDDLHWADPALLEFVDRLAEQSTEVPILVVGTSRPELHEISPAWPTAATDVVRLSLGHLDEAAVSALARALLGADSTQEDESTLVTRCGGNPLYAEEYARLLAEHTAAPATAGSMPDTVHALIAARIDTLPAVQKQILQDASVIGKVFWAGAVTTVGGYESASVDAGLRDLARRQHIRRARRSSLSDDAEFAFWHDLVHEVAYGQIPRERRGMLHRRTAEWIEALAGDRLADRAELLAHHYGRAFSLATATGGQDSEQLRARAVRYRVLAARHAMGLDLNHAERLLSTARDIVQPTDPEIIEVLTLITRCRTAVGDVDGALSTLAEARARAREAGDPGALSPVLLAALAAAMIAGDRPLIEELISEGIETLGGRPPTRDFAEFLMWAGAAKTIGGMEHEADALHAWARRCAQDVGDEALDAAAQNFQGTNRCMVGDRAGLDDLREGADRLQAAGSYLTCTARMQVADGILLFDGPLHARPVFEESIAVGERIRVDAHVAWARAEYAWCLDDQGAWDEALEQADAVFRWAAQHESSQHAGLIGGRTARLLALRGEVDQAADTIDIVLARTRRTTDPQGLVPTLAAAALVACLRDDAETARAFLDELGGGAAYCWGPTPDICRLLLASDQTERVFEVAHSPGPVPPRLAHALTTAAALLSEAGGNHGAALETYGQATAAWRSFGNPYELAHSLAGQARCLAALDRSAEAATPHQEAEEIFRRLNVQSRIWPQTRTPDPITA